MPCGVGHNSKIEGEDLLPELDELPPLDNDELPPLDGQCGKISLARSPKRLLRHALVTGMAIAPQIPLPHALIDWHGSHRRAVAGSKEML